MPFRKNGDVTHLTAVNLPKESVSGPALSPAEKAASLLRGQTLSAEEAADLQRVIDAASATSRATATPRK